MVLFELSAICGAGEVLQPALTIVESLVHSVNSLACLRHEMFVRIVVRAIGADGVGAAEETKCVIPTPAPQAKVKQRLSASKAPLHPSIQLTQKNNQINLIK